MGVFFLLVGLKGWVWVLGWFVFVCVCWVLNNVFWVVFLVGVVCFLCFRVFGNLLLFCFFGLCLGGVYFGF